MKHENVREKHWKMVIDYNHLHVFLISRWRTLRDKYQCLIFIVWNRSLDCWTSSRLNCRWTGSTTCVFIYIFLKFNIQCREYTFLVLPFEYHNCFSCSPSGSYLVMPFMGTDLGKLMKMEKLSEDRVQFLLYQMLRGLKVRDTHAHLKSHAFYSPSTEFQNVLQFSFVFSRSWHVASLSPQYIHSAGIIHRVCDLWHVNYMRGGWVEGWPLHSTPTFILCL